MPDKIQATTKQTTNWPTLDQVLDEADAEWAMQAALPDDQPAGMSEDARDAYLKQRLVGHLQTILIVSRRLK